MPSNTAAKRPITRNEFWRDQYRNNRYARHLTQTELDRRIRDIVLNLLSLTEQAKIGLLPIDRSGDFWMEKWTHALEEMQMRWGPYPSGFTRNTLHSEPFPDFVGKLGQKAAREMSRRNLVGRDVLIKFGKREFMTGLYERGSLRIQPASYFSQQTHIGAVRDDELTVPLSVALSRDQLLKLVVNPQAVPRNAPAQRLDIHLSLNTDYWLYCLTSSLAPRLFVDFQADSCVIIRDRAAFRRLFHDATQKRFEDTKGGDAPTAYVDPLLPKSSNIFVPLTKHFSYTYQQEYRFFWVPNIPAQHLTHIDLEVGSLKDIADFVELTP